MATHPQLCNVTHRKVLGLDNLYKKKIPHHCSHVLLVCIPCHFSALFFCVCKEEVKKKESVNVQQCKQVMYYLSTCFETFFAFVYDNLVILHIIMDLIYIFLYNLSVDELNLVGRGKTKKVPLHWE